MTYRFDDGQIGYPPIEAVQPVPALTPPNPFYSPGFIAVAEDPVWGPGEFVFARCGGSIRLYGGCVLLSVWDATNKVYTYNMTEWSNTTLLGQAGYIFMGNVAAVVGQYAWFMMTGRAPTNGTATIAANTAAGHNAAGQVTANAASLQLLNARVITPASNTVTANQSGAGVVGDTVIGISNVSGFFVGGYVSGTGIAANAIVTAIDPIGKTITVSLPHTAQVSGVVTQTANNGTIFYNVLEMNRMMLQGPIT